MSEAIDLTGESGDAQHGHLVSVTIDGTKKDIQAKDYAVPALKTALGVPADKDLDEIINGVITPLPDNGRVKVKGGEQFVSHARTGGSS